MAVSDVRAVMEFLRKNGFADTESALIDDISEKGELNSFDFERFLFPMLPPPPPVRVPDSVSTSGSDDEFVSLGSSVSDACSSGSVEFTNPYGLRAATHAPSDSSSDRLSQFGTARDYPDFDMQNDLYWVNDEDMHCFMPPSYGASDILGCPSEDKFVMTSDLGKQCDKPLMLNHTLEGLQPFPSIDYSDKSCLNDSSVMVTADVNEVHVTDYFHSNEKIRPGEGANGELDSCVAYDCPKPLCECGTGTGGSYCNKCAVYSNVKLKKSDLNYYASKVVGENIIDCDSALKQLTNKGSEFSPKRCSTNDWAEEFKSSLDSHVQFADIDVLPNGGYDVKGGEEDVKESPQLKADAEKEEGVAEDELPMYNASEDEHEVFNLKIIHRKNRTGFEENKDFPIVMNTMVAGRYYITEYLGSAAFSRVVQAHDIDTGVDVCLKIIKNDKDFFDQSLDEIKLLKLVNKYDPVDERHILRLYDYFYHQEHLFIVCELLRANLYEFQKFNQESGGEAYFTLSRLQVIARQCLEALEYLHHLRIIHCDLKPENILIKSYRRCEIKVIDLGSSCFQTDNLCLYVQSRSYRAPEVILGLPYDEKIDIWSLGCILAELCSGEVLFPNDALILLLARMIGMLGPIDLEMLVKGQETNKYFTKEYDLYHINEETNQLEYIIPESSLLEQQLQVSDLGFINFVRDLLEINPQRRLTAREALDHPWLSHPYDF